MPKPADIFERLSRLLKVGKKVALCTVVEKIGSGPTARGTKILVTDDGKIIGTVGRGEFERKVKVEALKAIKEGKCQMLHLRALRLGLPNAGGSVLIYWSIIPNR